MYGMWYVVLPYVVHGVEVPPALIWPQGYLYPVGGTGTKGALTVM